MAQYRNSFNNQVIESAATLGYPYIALPHTGTEFAARTADAILADVGDDPELAAEALAAEKLRETPRKVLTARLQKIIDDAEES